MIGRLQGVICERDALHGGCIVDVHGVGYEVFVPLRSLSALPQAPAIATLSIHTHVREDAIVLYGFLSVEDRRLFRALTSVSGVGPKLAMAILSDLTGAELSTAVANGDKKRFGAVSGVGAKLAARLVLELRDKVPLASGAAPVALEPAVSSSPRVGVPATKADEVVQMLVSLGFQRGQAEGAVASVVQPEDERPIEVLLRQALGTLAGR